jgi:hypothetical protein
MFDNIAAMVDDVSLLKNNQGGTGSSGVDYGGRIEALETVAARIPTTFKNTEWIQLLTVVGSFPKPGIDLMKDLSWEMVFNAVKKIPTLFQVNTLQAMKDVVVAIPNAFNSSTWTDVTNAVKKVPSVFTIDTLQQLYDVDDLKNNQGGTDGDTGSNEDYETRIQALETKVAKIPGALNTVTWNYVTMKTNVLPLLPDLPIETLTWVDVVAAVKKIPSDFTNSTLINISKNLGTVMSRIVEIPILPSVNESLTWTQLVNAVKMIPELQQTVSNMISQLNAQSFIDLNTLHTALDEADGSLQTIADRLQQMQ